MPPGGQKSLLGGILSGLGITQHPQRQVEDTPLVHYHQLVKAGYITLPAALDKFIFRHGTLPFKKSSSILTEPSGLFNNSLTAARHWQKETIVL
jgi:hypothetical protein